MRILLIEDDKDLCNALKIALEKAGYQTDLCCLGDDALYYARMPVYDLIILDRMLPGMDGLSILKTLRKEHIMVPVILATALDAVHERILGLDEGADDYIVKPYDVGELLARIRALIRRPPAVDNKRLLTWADLSFQPDIHELSCNGKSQLLSLRESMLLERFLQNPAQTIHRQVLYSHIWGPDGEVEDGNLDTYIYYVRKVLKKVGSAARITTVHGVGYRLEIPDSPGRI